MPAIIYKLIRFNYLWRGVARRSARGLECLARFVDVTQAEVNHFERAVKVKQKIFGFQIPVANPELVNVVNASDEFLEVLAGCLFLEALALDDQLEKLAAVCELHDQVEVFFGLDDLVDLNHVRVVQLFQNFDFP